MGGSTNTYRVLSLDGGGIRGIVPAVILQRLLAEPGLGRLLDNADLIAGTSTGGLIALGIAHGLDLARMRDLYVKKGPKIFDDSWLDDLVDLGRLRGAEYGNKALRRELGKLFGQTTLGQLKKRVLITSFDLDNEDRRHDRRSWKPKLFHNFPGPNTDRSQLAYKVGLYTSAAPTYFPSVDGYIDGSVYASNPSMCALAQTQDQRYKPTPSLDNVVLLALGTGTSLYYIKGRSHDWGYVQWAKPLVRLMLDGVAGIADYQCHQILHSRYHRLAPVFPESSSVAQDDTDKIPYLLNFAQKLDVKPTIDWLRKNWGVN